MMCLFAKSSKGQMKMQQTAFMLVALVIFFSMVGLIYFSISMANLRKNAAKLAEKEALETVKMLAGTPEFAFTSSSDCSNCVDLDKVLLLSEKMDSNYKNFWNFEQLEVEIVYPKPSSNAKCTKANYPTCKNIVLIEKGEKKPKTAFVTLARWDSRLGTFKYELGKIHATEKNLTK